MNQLTIQAFIRNARIVFRSYYLGMH